MKFLVDKLESKYSYPCTIKEIKEFLKEIPPDDLDGIKSIRLCNQKTNNDGGYIKDGRLELIYFVDKDLKKEVQGYMSGSVLKDTERFGGIKKNINGKEYICWSSENLKKYIKFVLLHEIGHHIYYKKFGKLTGSSEEEDFCSNYANKYVR
jgi:hypothetical protein